MDEAPGSGTLQLIRAGILCFNLSTSPDLEWSFSLAREFVYLVHNKTLCMSLGVGF